MRVPVRAGLSLATAATLAACGSVAALPVLAASSQDHVTRAGWRLDKTISVRDRHVLLSDIHAIGPGNAWVAGEIWSKDGSVLKALIEHWSGRAWAPVPLPAGEAVRFRGASLDAIGASSGRNVWAFSSTTNGYLHLAGRRWIFARLPRQFSKERASVEYTQVFSPADVWVFGQRDIGPGTSLKSAPFAARFNGSSWETVHIGGIGSIGPVSALSATDMWSLTGTVIPIGLDFPNNPKVVHWAGRVWRAAAVQPRLPRNATLTAILALSDRDIWIGGSIPNDKTGTSELAMHWNGKSWTAASPPAPATEADEFLASLVPDGSGGLWAAAEAFPGPARFWHYTGGAWSAPFNVRPGWLYPELAAVPRSRSVWAIAFSRGLVNGLILVHGALPR